jgi:GT2 family glycosyltransferase
MDYYSGMVCNWCHPKNLREYADSPFETCEISEGAVVFKRDVLSSVGFYPEDFFISHEGADLAARIIDRGYAIYYSPLIKVFHKYATNSRPGWRRYYYDTRNDFWLAIREYRLIFLILHLLRRVPVTFVYAVRDGFLSYWLRAIKDVALELPKILRQRDPISWKAHKTIRYLNRGKPGIYFLIKERLFSRQIKI